MTLYRILITGRATVVLQARDELDAQDRVLEMLDKHNVEVKFEFTDIAKLGKDPS